MRRNLHTWLTVGLVVPLAASCSAGRGRTYQPDPFQDARQPRVSGAEVVGNTSPSRQIAAQRDSEVTQTTGQASSEYDYRTVARSAEQSANGFVPSSASQPGHRN